MTLSDVVKAAAVKMLTTVDLPGQGSNQHEINGVGALRGFFGSDETVRGLINWRYLSDEREYVEGEGGFTFYDARANHPIRTEWRLYYEGNFLALATPGDTLLLVRTREDVIYGLALAAGSAPARMASHLIPHLDVGHPQLRLVPRDDINAADLALCELLVLQALGVEVAPPALPGDEEVVSERFGRRFPTTKLMSALARELHPGDPVDEPDLTLVGWIEREEALFRALEQLILSEQLEQGFANVDDFIRVSLSVQNRRKARMGHALQNHLAAVLEAHALRFESQAVTEGQNRPDFLFPDGAAYHDESFPSDRLSMLGAKSTCKDRWRQVLTEADRIRAKHLCTLEPGISATQTEEMRRQHLALVLPAPLHDTYGQDQQEELWTLAHFIRHVSYLQDLD